MEVIKDTVHSVMRGLIAKKRGPENDPQGWLEKALTKKELQHIQFNYFKKGILNLDVDSSSRLYSLNLKKGDLLAKLNKVTGAIKDIRFRIGEIR